MHFKRGVEHDICVKLMQPFSQILLVVSLDETGSQRFNPASFRNEIQAESLPPGCPGYNPTSVRNKILATSLPLRHPGYDPDGVGNRILPTSLPLRHMSGLHLTQIGARSPDCISYRPFAFPANRRPFTTLRLPSPMMARALVSEQSIMNHEDSVTKSAAKAASKVQKNWNKELRKKGVQKFMMAMKIEGEHEFEMKWAEMVAEWGQTSKEWVKYLVMEWYSTKERCAKPWRKTQTYHIDFDIVVRVNHRHLKHAYNAAFGLNDIEAATLLEGVEGSGYEDLRIRLFNNPKTSYAITFNAQQELRTRQLSLLLRGRRNDGVLANACVQLHSINGGLLKLDWSKKKK
ncbi:hypothetical protein BT69DRAFT_1305684 [Atractiella rhizophila]|nr:hypothetical protein BT69DRAFT_1305684 [Atractiella rhizophila]